MTGVSARNGENGELVIQFSFRFFPQSDTKEFKKYFFAVVVATGRSMTNREGDSGLR